MRIIRMGQQWQHIPKWLWAESMIPHTKGLQGEFFEPLLDELRDLAPPGSTEPHSHIAVILPPGKAVGLHSHPQWTLIYYIDAEDVPIIVDGIAIYPANNTAIMLEPETPHEVARNQTDRPRLSLAFRFKPCAF